MKKFLIVVGILACIGFIAALAAAPASRPSSTTTGSALDAQQNSVSAPSSSSAKKVKGYGDGTWEVGSDIKAGTYKTKGGQDCYWERLSSSDDILSNNFGDGPQVVHIRSTDGTFKSDGCGHWVRQK